MVVALAGAFLVVLGLLAWVRTAIAERFLLGFASSQSLHVLELVLRLSIGTAFVVHAPASRWPEGFSIFGWLLVGTTLCLSLVPWRWHRRFAERTVPQALRFLRLIGTSSLLFGSAILFAMEPGGLS